MLGWYSAFSATRFGTVSWWQARGVNTYIVATSNHVLEYGTIEDECKFLDDLGRIFAVKDQTDEMIRAIYEELERDAHLIAGKKPPSVMVIEINGRTITNYDPKWLVGDMVKRLGGYMPASERRLSDESLFAYDPDVIFVVYFNSQHRQQAEQFLGNVKFNSLQAWRNKRIHMLPFWYMYTPGVNTLEGIRAIKKGLHPE
ncbi:MAG: ABC transporter substrate-binding protein [Schwartzia sp. (in: firmicutes)]